MVEEIDHMGKTGSGNVVVKAGDDHPLVIREPGKNQSHAQRVVEPGITDQVLEERKRSILKPAAHPDIAKTKKRSHLDEFLKIAARDLTLDFIEITICEHFLLSLYLSIKIELHLLKHKPKEEKSKPEKE